MIGDDEGHDRQAPGPGSNPGAPDDLARRRAALDQRLAEHRTREAASAPSTKPGGMQAMAHGLKIASEFVAGVAVGALLGFGIDHFLGTRPFGLILFLLLGFAAGVLNVIRGAKAAPGGSSNGPTQDSDRSGGE